MSRPWMPFYVSDYVADTLHLTTEQHGAYILLMCHYWRHDGLPTDENQLMAIAKLSEVNWRSNCQVLHNFFTKDWRHKRIEVELAKAKSISKKRQLAGMKGAWKRHGTFIARG